MNLQRLFTVAALTAILLAGACDQVNFTAPTGSTLTLTVQPPTIAVNGFANLTVTGTRESGAPLPDGTSVSFTTDLGSIDPNPAETKDGVATARFHAGIRSGTANISATSGAATITPVTVIIGEARAGTVQLVASPSTLPVGGGKVNLKAHVFDENGNSLGGVGVIFTTNAGVLDSLGRTVKTNDSGVAFDILRTTIAASITATTQNAKVGTASVAVGQVLACAFAVSPTSPVIGQPVTFTDLNGAANGLTFLWDFGDGSTGEGQVVTHTFDNQGEFTVIHTVIDSQGFSTACAQTVIITRGEPLCTITSNDETPKPGQVVTFDASESSDPNGIIVNYRFDFHDGSPVVSQSSPVVTHTFINAGNFVVELTVTDNDGIQTICTVNEFVDPNN